MSRRMPPRLALAAAAHSPRARRRRDPIPVRLIGINDFHGNLETGTSRSP